MQLHLPHQGTFRRLRGRGVKAQVMRQTMLLLCAKPAVQQLLGTCFLLASPPSRRHALQTFVVVSLLTCALTKA